MKLLIRQQLTRAAAANAYQPTEASPSNGGLKEPASNGGDSSQAHQGNSKLPGQSTPRPRLRRPRRDKYSLDEHDQRSVCFLYGNYGTAGLPLLCYGWRFLRSELELHRDRYGPDHGSLRTYSDAHGITNRDRDRDGYADPDAMCGDPVRPDEQSRNDGNGSQDFETANDGFDNQGADDFVDTATPEPGLHARASSPPEGVLFAAARPSARSMSPSTLTRRVLSCSRALQKPYITSRCRTKHLHDSLARARRARLGHLLGFDPGADGFHSWGRMGLVRPDRDL